MRWAAAATGMPVAAGLLSMTGPVRAEQGYALSQYGVLRWLQDPACSGDDCRWVEIDRNERTAGLAATSNKLFQAHDDGPGEPGSNSG